MRPIPLSNPFAKTLDIGEPPFDLFNSKLSFYPLAADPVQLEGFINAYLNIAPKSTAVFKPAAPYVLMIMAEYLNAGNDRYKLGVASPTEVGFAVPITRHRLRQGRLVFENAGFVFPFIFISDQWAQSTGRQIYGWTKVLGGLTGPPDPARHLGETWQPFAGLETQVVSQLYSGETPQVQQLMGIEHRSSNLSRFPPDLDLNSSPWFLPARQAAGALGLAETGLDYLWWLARSRQLATPVRMLLRLLNRFFLSAGRGGVPTPAIDLINLKQFRDAQFQEDACYQAIVNSPMLVNSLLDFELMGFSALLGGDLSGGLRLRMNLFPSQPIVSLLGLEVESWEWGRTRDRDPLAEVSAGPAGKTSLGTLSPPSVGTGAPLDPPQVAILKPVLPFWARLDLTYLRGKTLTWRFRDSPWLRRSRKRPNRTIAIRHSDRRPAAYDSARGSAIDELAGPWILAGTTLRLLTLRAKRSVLAKQVRAYLDTLGSPYTFEALGDRVLVLILSTDETISDSQNLFNWAGRSLRFAIPIAYYPKGRPRRRRTALLVPFSFTSSETGSIIESEVYGFPTRMAELQSPPEPWMDWAGPVGRQPLLYLWTSMFAAVDLGQRPIQRILVEVARRAGQGNAPQPTGPDPSNASDAVDQLLSRAGRRHRLDFITLKQFPTAEHINQACYQAIVRTEVHLHRTSPLQDIPGDLALRIHQNPDFPIETALGLLPNQVNYDRPIDPRIVYEVTPTYDLSPLRAQWCVSDLRIEKAEDLAWRGQGSSRWQIRGPRPRRPRRRPPEHGPARRRPDSVPRKAADGSARHRSP